MPFYLCNNLYDVYNTVEADVLVSLYPEKKYACFF